MYLGTRITESVYLQKHLDSRQSLGIIAFASMVSD